MTTDDVQWTTLADEQAASFDRDGFLLVPGALDPDMVARICEVGDRLVASDLQQGRRDLGRTDGFRNCVVLDPVFLELLCYSRTLPLVVQLMGPHLQLQTSDLIWRSPDADDSDAAYRDPGWHRDIGRVTRDLDHDRMPRLEIKVAYYLTDCPTEAYGQTRVAAGSHRWRENWQRADGDIDPPGTTAPIFKAGDALLFENRCWHAGGPNKSDQIRKTLMMGYSHNWIRPDDYDTQDEAFLNRCTPLQRCLMEQTSGNFDEKGRFRVNSRVTPLQTWANENGYKSPACH